MTLLVKRHKRALPLGATPAMMRNVLLPVYDRSTGAGSSRWTTATESMPGRIDCRHQTDFLLGMTWEASPDAEFQVQARPLAYPHPAGGSDWMPMSGITMYDEWEEYWSWYGNMMHPSDHEYRVRAVDGGAYSDWVYLSVDGAPSYDLPDRPSGLAASSVTSSSFTVTWTPVEDAMYQVALVEPLSMRHPYNITWSTGTVQYVYSEPWQATFSNLQAGRTYQVVVMSISTWHGSFYANESAMLQVRTAPSPAGAPAAPSDLQVRPKDDLSGIELRWLDNSNDETGFTIARSGGGTVYFYPSANQISYLDTTAQPGVSYTYWVLARNAYGNSSWSNSAGATIVLPTVRIEADIADASETPGDWGQFKERAAWARLGCVTRRRTSRLCATTRRRPCRPTTRWRTCRRRSWQGTRRITSRCIRWRMTSMRLMRI
jgi:hypothetical protein